MESQSSSIWAYFTKSVGADDKTKAVCKHCPKSFLMCKGSTSGIRYHLKTDHPACFAQLLRRGTAQKRRRIEEREELDAAEEEAEVLTHVTPQKRSRGDADFSSSMPEAGLDRYRKFACGDRRQLAFDMSVTQYIVTSALPFKHVETEAFRTLMSKVQPRANVKSATTFTRSKLPRLHASMRQDLEKVLADDLSDCPGVGFSTDLWTSRAGDPFLSLTIHYLSKEWNLKRYTLECMPFEGHHTAVRIAAALDQKLKGLQTLANDAQKVLVHDAAANMKAAVRKSSSGLDSFVCFDHRLQTVLRKAFADCDELDHLMQKANDLSSLMHRSPLTCQQIQAECALVGTKYVKVIAPVATRWNSRYMMVESINTISPALSSLKEKSIDIGTSLFSESELDLLKKIEFMLAKFDEASKQMSADKIVTMPLVVSNLVNLRGWTERWIARGDVQTADLARRMKHHLEAQFSQCGMGEMESRFGHFFHPYYRGAFLKQEGLFDSTIDELIDGHPSTHEFRNRAAATQRLAESVDIFTETINDDDMDPADALMRTLSTGGQVQQEKSPMEIEIAAYMSMVKPLLKGLTNVVGWWKEHEKTLPLLASYARRFIAIPASSASSERLFSTAGNVVTARRYNLDPSTTEMLTFCQQNWPHLRAHGWSVEKEMAETETATSAPSSQEEGPQQGPSRGSRASSPVRRILITDSDDE